MRGGIVRRSTPTMARSTTHRSSARSRATRAHWLSRKLAATGAVAGGVVVIIIPALLLVAFGLLQGIQFVGTVAEKTTAVIQSLEEPDDEEEPSE